MGKVIQIRDVPEDVHEVLSAAAAVQGVSLNNYLSRELTKLAQRTQAVEANLAVIRETQRAVGADVSRDSIVSALNEGRGE